MHFQLIIFVSVLLPVAHLEPTRPCCQLEHLEKCTVFQHAGRSICTQTSEDDNNHGGCPRKVRQDPDDVPSHVSLVDYTVGYSPCNPSEDSSAGCSGDGSGSLVVTLNVSFTLDGNNVEELLFQVDGLRDTRTSCHYVRLIETLTHGDVIQNQKKRLLYFDGFDEDFLPGSTHVVYARTLPDHVDSSFHVVSNLSVKIPDCNWFIERRDKVYYCTLPSPAKWHSDVYAEEVYDGAISSVHVTFTTSDEAPRIGYYKVTLGRSDMRPTKYKIIFNNSTFWHWNGTLGSNVLEHTFVNVTPGTYNVTVHPRFLDEPCTDPLWSMENDCPEFGRSFQVKGEAVTVPSTTLPPPPPLVAAPWTLLNQHWYWLLGVVVVAMVLLILLAGVCRRVCWKKKQPIIGPDDITIYKSERRFIHRPLERPYKPVNGVEGSIPDQTLSYQEDGGSQLLDYHQAGNDWEGVLRQDSGISVSSHNEVDNHVGVSGTTPPIMEEVDIESVL